MYSRGKRERRNGYGCAWYVPLPGVSDVAESTPPTSLV